MGYIIGNNRDQIEIICLDEMVEEDSPARQIDRMVDEADTSYFEKSETKGKGRPPFDPKDLLKLYVYGFENGIYSSRKLERECKRNTEAMWLLKGLQPDDKTVSNFRKENAGSIKRFFDEFCVKLARAGYMDGKVVSVDGTKIRANNSKRNNYSLKKLNRQIEYVNGRLAEYMTELDKNDEIEKLQARRVKYEGYKKQIESGAVTEVSATDPDSRMMKQGNNGVDVSYNVQTAVDGKHKLIAGILVTNEPNDQGQLHKVSKSVKDNLGFKEMTVPADKGYYDTDDIKACHDDNITTLVAKPDVREAERGFFKKQDFKYLPEDDVFVCPAGAKLKGSKPDDNGYKRYRNSKACSHCPLKDKCTTGDRKDLGRHQYAEHTEQNDSDFKNNQHIYKQRQQLSEHPFGTVKRTMGFRQFLTRGTANVTAETALIFLIYNLKRLRGINKNDNKTDGEPVALLRLFAGLFTSFAIFHCHSNLFRLSHCPYPFFTQSAVPLTAAPLTVFLRSGFTLYFF